MINKNILSQVFDNYGINKVMLLEYNNSYNFLISEMNKELSLDRWEYLENILKDITKKNINLIPYSQAKKYFNDDINLKGEVIK